MYRAVCMNTCMHSSVATKKIPSANQHTLDIVTASWNPYSAKKIKNAPIIFKMVLLVRLIVLQSID